MSFQLEESSLSTLSHDHLSAPRASKTAYAPRLPFVYSSMRTLKSHYDESSCLWMQTRECTRTCKAWWPIILFYIYFAMNLDAVKHQDKQTLIIDDRRKLLVMFWVTCHMAGGMQGTQTNTVFLQVAFLLVRLKKKKTFREHRLLPRPVWGACNSLTML